MLACGRAELVVAIAIIQVIELHLGIIRERKYYYSPTLLVPSANVGELLASPAVFGV